MQNNHHTLHERFASFWWGERGPSAHLLLLLITFMLAPLIESELGKGISSFFFSLILLSGVATISHKLLPRIGVAAVALTAMILTWLRHFNPENHTLQSLEALVTLCYLLILTSVIMVFVFQEGRMSASRIQAGVAAYILIGLVCAVIYRLLELHSPGTLSISPATVGQVAHVRDAEFTYFSFATLTTLGYGDIVALKPTARMVVIIEALIGQLFPATLLARLVSLQNTRSDNGPCC